ncbi:hypothetical protein SAY87_004732 [Trapa incisa]|uniref:DUF3444 domain-containing protein n=1 Tax=Trapa incisa TaxID=236973 RepID=A0AAN7PT89_9MYRT|nr:hypothetical protein SAY87_004732 [Trapa incisa]
MPRYYAQVRKVFSPGFRLKITWFETDPYEKDQDEVNWCLGNLPVACGRYSFGGSEVTEDRLMFSHQIIYKNGDCRGTFLVYPRKGEIWALFMNWDIKWSLEPEKHSCFTYEFAEVLSDFVEGSALPLETFAPCVRNLRNSNSNVDGDYIGGGCASQDKIESPKWSKEVGSSKNLRNSNFERQSSIVRRSLRVSSKQSQINSDSTAKKVQFTNMEEVQEEYSYTSHSKL